MAKRIKLINVSKGIVRVRGVYELTIGQSIPLTVTDKEYLYYKARPKIYRVILVEDDVDIDPKPEKKEVIEAVKKGIVPVDIKDNETVAEITEEAKDATAEEEDEELEVDENQPFVEQLNTYKKKQLQELLLKMGLADDFAAVAGVKYTRATTKQLRQFLMNEFTATKNVVQQASQEDNS